MNRHMYGQEYKEWYDKIIWYKGHVTLLGGKPISKQGYITNKGFNTIGFNQLLQAIYNKEEII